MLTSYSDIRYLSIAIERSPETVYAFASDPLNLPKWAAGLGRGVRRRGEHWEVLTEGDPVGLRFTGSNPYGVMDHTVFLPDGSEVYVPMRVMPNGKGSEMMLGLFRQPDMDDATFERDAGLMRADLERLKALLESA